MRRLAFDFAAQRVEVGGGAARVGRDGLRIDKRRIDLLQAVARFAQQAVQLRDGGLRLIPSRHPAENWGVGFLKQGVCPVERGDQLWAFSSPPRRPWPWRHNAPCICR